MKLAVSIITPEVRGEAPLALLSGPFAERLRKAADFGYQGAELVCCEPKNGSVAELQDRLAEAGLAPAAIATGFLAGGYGVTLTGPEESGRALGQKRLEELIELAGALNCGIVTIGSFRGKAAPLGGAEAAKEQLHRVFAAVSALCKEQNVTLALEPICPKESDFLTDASQVVQFLKEGGHENGGLLLDSYHVVQSEPDPLGVYAAYQSRLVHVHLADSRRLPLGQGSIDFAAMERALETIGYAGWQSAELARSDAPDPHAATSARYILGL